MQLLDPSDRRVKWRDEQVRPNTDRVYAFLKTALDRDFLDLKKSKRYKTTVYVNNESSEDGGELTLEKLAGYLESPQGQLMKQERIRLLVDAFDDDPKAKELVRLQLDPEGYNAFTNKELAELLDTSIGDIENRKKRVKNRLLQILRRHEKGTRTYA